MEKRITEIKLRLKEIEAEKEILLKELENLFQKEKSTELTPNEKIKLFRSLFKARNDVYARKWKNKEKIGYSPVKTYTGDYLPLTDEVIKSFTGNKPQRVFTLRTKTRFYNRSLSSFKK